MHDIGDIVAVVVSVIISTVLTSVIVAVIVVIAVVITVIIVIIVVVVIVVVVTVVVLTVVGVIIDTTNVLFFAILSVAARVEAASIKPIIAQKAAVKETVRVDNIFAVSSGPVG
jgi:hypothetical protein